jgi:hypothetical protein
LKYHKPARLDSGFSFFGFGGAFFGWQTASSSGKTAGIFHATLPATRFLTESDEK